MNHGTKPTRIDHRDYDLHKTFGAAVVPSFPDEFFCDAGLTMPDQNQVNNQFNPPLPPWPEGCTSYIQSEIATDLKGQLKNPAALEAITHSNARGGYGIRESLLAAKSLGWFTGFFNIRAKAPLDFFDSFRLAQISGLPDEHRSITFGTPWFPSWEDAAKKKVAIMPMPTPDEILQVTKDPNSIPWHNSKLDGWTKRNGVLFYRDKSLQGYDVGENGFIFFPREVINVVMSISGTVGYTGTDLDYGVPQRIDTTVVQYIVSLVRTAMQNFFSPPAPKAAYAFGTPEQARHSIRVICDEEGLTYYQKDVITACIQQESGFYNYLPDGNPTKNDNISKLTGKILSTDWGLCQINDYYHIGVGKDFPSVEYVLSRPDEVVRYMIRMMKAGKLNLWVSYSSGAYQKYMPKNG